MCYWENGKKSFIIREMIRIWEAVEWKKIQAVIWQRAEKSCLQNVVRKEQSNVRHRDRDSVSLYTLCTGLCCLHHGVPILFRQQTFVLYHKAEVLMHKITCGCTEPYIYTHTHTKIKILKFVHKVIMAFLMHKIISVFLWYTITKKNKKLNTQYCIRPKFRGTQFSRIAISKHFTETIFTNQKFQEFRVYGILKFRELNFRGLLGIHENRENYAPRKFGLIRYIITQEWSNNNCCYYYRQDKTKTWQLLWRKKPLPLLKWFLIVVRSTARFSPLHGTLKAKLHKVKSQLSSDISNSSWKITLHSTLLTAMHSSSQSVKAT